MKVRFAFALPALCSLVMTSAAAARGQTPPQTQTPPVQSGATVTVTAHEAEVIADALHTLKVSGDSLVAITVADSLLKLADAMAVAHLTYQIGPLTPQEQSVVDINELMKEHAVAGGPIHLQVRPRDFTDGTGGYDFTRSSFISLWADIASDSAFSIGAIRQTKTIFVARTILDLNTQAHGLIPERQVLLGVLRGFKMEDPHGVITSRVLDIADAIAASGKAYDLVPREQTAAFLRRPPIDHGELFAKVPEAREGLVNVRYDGAIYAASVDHFEWFFVRFLLEDPPKGGWDGEIRGVDLGGKILDYLSVQLQMDAVDAVTEALDRSGTAGVDGISLGTFRASGPGLDLLKHAPGVSQDPSPLGAGYCVLMVSPQDARKLADLRKWLADRSRDLGKKISGA